LNVAANWDRSSSSSSGFLGFLVFLGFPSSSPLLLGGLHDDEESPPLSFASSSPPSLGVFDDDEGKSRPYNLGQPLTPFGEPDLISLTYLLTGELDEFFALELGDDVAHPREVGLLLEFCRIGGAVQEAEEHPIRGVQHGLFAQILFGEGLALKNDLVFLEEGLYHKRYLWGSEVGFVLTYDDPSPYLHCVRLVRAAAEIETNSPCRPSRTAPCSGRTLRALSRSSGLLSGPRHRAA
jgi:hypothetical protein